MTTRSGPTPPQPASWRLAECGILLTERISSAESILFSQCFDVRFKSIFREHVEFCYVLPIVRNVAAIEHLVFIVVVRFLENDRLPAKKIPSTKLNEFRIGQSLHFHLRLNTAHRSSLYHQDAISKVG